MLYLHTVYLEPRLFGSLHEYKSWPIRQVTLEVLERSTLSALSDKASNNSSARRVLLYSTLRLEESSDDC